MTTDWNLTTLLAALGGVVLVGLLAQGWWSARKAGPRRAEPIVPAGDRQEPSLGAGGAATGQSPVTLDGTADGEAVDSRTMDLRTLDETVPAMARARKASTRIDALIDAIATMTPESPVSGEMALSHLPGSRRAGTKPFHIEGLNVGQRRVGAAACRVSATASSRRGVQMANRSGGLNEIEYSEFVQKIQGFAGRHRCDGRSSRTCWTSSAGRASSTSSRAGHDAQLGDAR